MEKSLITRGFHPSEDVPSEVWRAALQVRRSTLFRRNATLGVRLFSSKVAENDRCRRLDGVSERRARRSRPSEHRSGRPSGPTLPFGVRCHRGWFLGGAAGKALFAGLLALLQTGNMILLIRNAILLIGNVVFPIRKTVLLIRNVVFPIRNGVLLIRNVVFPIRKMALLIGNVIFPIRKRVLLIGNVVLLIRKMVFPLSKMPPFISPVIFQSA